MGCITKTISSGNIAPNSLTRRQIQKDRPEFPSRSFVFSCRYIRREISGSPGWTRTIISEIFEKYISVLADPKNVIV